jgi:ubiquinone/menaquinone biosynthesis C-methylase UbiE
MDCSKKMMTGVEPEHYVNESYNTKERFISYWYQINELLKLKPRYVLEIGVGNRFVSQYLMEKRINIVTLDVDKRLRPDVIGSVLDIPFPERSFDIVACYEILEHLPYNNFHKALVEIFRVSSSFAALSLPDVDRVYRLAMQIPRLGEIRKLIPIPRIRKLIHTFDGEHYWEIGKDSYPLSRIKNDIQKVGFHIERTYRVFEYPYHRFFILQKQDG